MWSVFAILIGLQLVQGNAYYWRDYNRTIPSDAYRDLETNSFPARIYSQKFPGYHPTWLNHSTGTEVKYANETISDITQVLCTEDTKKFYWEWVNAPLLRTSDQEKIVKGGYDSYGDVYIAKIFYKGYWYLGELDGMSCYFYSVKDCYHKITTNNWCQTPDCMVLKYK